ncbi:MAG: radical SAM protein [archaeon]
MDKIERLSRWAEGGSAGPVTIELNPTNRCNLKCRSCWLREHEPEPAELDRGRIASVISEASRLGVKEIRIPGSGEPLLSEGIREAIGQIKSEGMHGLLITNGTLLDSAIPLLVDSKWDVVTVSIDGPDPEVNDYLRGRDGTFNKIIRNIEALNQLKKETGARLPVLRINTVISNRNYNRIAEMAELANRLKCSDIQFQPMTVWGREGRELELSPDERSLLPRHIKKAAEIAEKHGTYTNVLSFLDGQIVENASESMDELIKKKGSCEKNPFLNAPCFEPWYNMIILPDGSVGPCSMSGGHGGDNLNGRSLRDIWDGRAFGTIRKRLLAGDLPHYCRQCCAVVHVENERIKHQLIAKTRRSSLH